MEAYILRLIVCCLFSLKFFEIDLHIYILCENVSNLISMKKRCLLNCCFMCLPTIVRFILGEPGVPSGSSEPGLYTHSKNLYQKERLIPEYSSWDQNRFRIIEFRSSPIGQNYSLGSKTSFTNCLLFYFIHSFRLRMIYTNKFILRAFFSCILLQSNTKIVLI